MTRWWPGRTRVNLASCAATATVGVPAAVRFRRSEENGLAIAPIDTLEHMPDLVQRAVRTRAIHHGGNDIAIGFGGGGESGEPLGYKVGIPPRPEIGEPAALGTLRLFTDLEDLDRSLALLQEVIDADDHAPALLHLRLEPGGAVGDLPLEPAGLDGADDPALRLDLGEESAGLGLQGVGQRLDEMRPAERI